MKKDHNLKIAGLAVAAALGVAMLPGLLAAPAHATAPEPTPAALHTPTCIPYDEFIAQIESIDPRATYVVIGENGEEERTVGHRGPVAQARVDAAVEMLRRRQAAGVLNQGCAGNLR